MKNIERIVYGLTITIVIFLTALFAGREIHLDSNFIASTFPTHTAMIIFSLVAMILLKKNLTYNISLPKFRLILKPILYGILATILVNLLMTILTKVAGGKIEAHPLIDKLKPIQVFIFVFIYASFAEEILFRGFLMNLLKPLNQKGISLFKRKISIPVIISAIMFGLAHLCLMTTGVGFFFLFRVVVFTMTLGLIAGYYQEKYDNNSYAIIVHMSGNLIAVLGSVLIHMNM